MTQTRVTNNNAWEETAFICLYFTEKYEKQ